MFKLRSFILKDLISTRTNLCNKLHTTSTKMSNKKFKVFVTQPIPKQDIDIMESNNIELTINEKTPLDRNILLGSVKNCDALFVTLNEKIDKQVLDSCGENLKVVFLFF